MNSSSTPEPTSRRDFIKASTAIAVTSALAPYISLTGRAATGDTIKVGLVGCGGRGSGAAHNALKADPNVVLTAVGDIYEETALRSLENLKNAEGVNGRVQVDKKNIFVGLDSYKGVIESGVDVVLLATPPGFRPEHMKAAVAAGKHMFVEKPMATDAPGLRSSMETVAAAKEKGLGICAGYCWRYNLAQRGLYEQVHAGAIGEIRAMYATYNTGALWNRATPKDTTPLQKQLRNWLYYTWLSGDHLCEQAIHAVDWMQWAMKEEKPVRCIAHGGRQVRTEEVYGNIYDHFEVVYEYANGARGFLFSRQQAGCANDNSAVYYGTKGTARETGFNGMPYILDQGGKRTWRYEGPRPDMYDQEHKEFFASLRAGKPINDGDRMNTSTMTGIMGRLAAYTGQQITWDEALNSKEELVPKNLTWETPAPAVTVAMPGITKFV